MDFLVKLHTLHVEQVTKLQIICCINIHLRTYLTKGKIQMFAVNKVVGVAVKQHVYSVQVSRTTVPQ